MVWSKIDTALIPVNTPVLVRTEEDADPIVAFLEYQAHMVRRWRPGTEFIDTARRYPDGMVRT